MKHLSKSKASIALTNDPTALPVRQCIRKANVAITELLQDKRRNPHAAALIDEFLEVFREQRAFGVELLEAPTRLHEKSR